VRRRRHLLHGDLRTGLAEDAPVHASEPASAEQLLAAEPRGGVEQILVREPVVRPERELPVLAHLGVPAPPPHPGVDGAAHGEDQRR